jgi:7-cyano-7-deazaguanine synthase
MKHVVLFSGGMDSAAILLGRPKESTTALFFHYGQPHDAAEFGHAKRFTTRHDYTLRTELLPSLSGGICSGDSSPVVPGRNALFLSFACSVAESMGAERVWIGCTRADREVFPDCRPRFLRSFNEMLAAAGVSVQVDAPLLMSSKRDVADLLRARGGDPAETWSCYHPQPMPKSTRAQPCGECGACLARAGVRIPTPRLDNLQKRLMR